MPFTWVLNLDAELELARPGYNRSAKTAAQLERYVELARAELLGPDDRVAGEPPSDPHTASVGRAWCPTPRAVASLLRAGATPEHHPDASVLRAVNHRRFALELGAGPAAARWIDSASDLRRLLAVQGDGPWLLKRALGFAGRGQLRLRGPASATDWSWIEASLADGFVLEPLLELTAEFSLHGFVWPDGRYELGRPCLQLTEHGAFRRARLVGPGDLGADERRTLLDRGAAVAAALAGRRYFGPFGIDAYRYGPTGALSAGFCALSEINARYTMAFTLGFGRGPSELVR